MKRKRRLGKLALNRETLRRLSNGSLEQAVGGVEAAGGIGAAKTMDYTCNPSCNEYTCYLNANQTCKNNCTASNPCCVVTD